MWPSARWGFRKKTEEVGLGYMKGETEVEWTGGEGEAEGRERANGGRAKMERRKEEG